jgi:hypothetical protein
MSWEFLMSETSTFRLVGVSATVGFSWISLSENVGSKVYEAVDGWVGEE